jgi:hypothetical protein
VNIAGCLDCRECFSIAISVEISLRKFCLHMADLYAGHVEASEMLHLMARDEAEHAMTLEIAKTSGRHPIHVHETASKDTLILLKLLGRIGQQMGLSHSNFDEVWEFAMMIERSEVNHIYLNLTSQTLHSTKASDQYISNILKTHVQRLFDFGGRFGKKERLSILPKTI